MSIDPDLGAVMLALGAGVGLLLSRRRRTCEICGRRMKSVLCACEKVAEEGLDGAERKLAELCEAHGLPACTQCGPPHVRS